MSLLVKICGVTREADVAAAAAAGADAVGFVFHAPSSRNLEPHRAALLASALPRRVLRVAVTLHPTQSQVDTILGAFAPDVWQSDLADFEDLRIPGKVQRWPVLRSGEPLPASLPPTVLFDAIVSGSGTRADWQAAAALARRVNVILAGGLTPATVAHAVAAVNPMGVDVSSGVESSAGVKDGRRIREFVMAAQATDKRANTCMLR
jgi:phosphoribosylanthranilate isomerase